MKILTFVLAVAIVLSAIAIAFYFTPPNTPPAASTPALAGPPLTTFQLTERSGETFDSKDLEGKIWVGSFFFTSCGSNCRLLNMKKAELQREFGPMGVRFVSISCDPTVDTPGVLSEYADRFRADPNQWLFLTGDLPYAQRIGRDMFHVSVDRRAHFDQLIVMDASGNSRGAFLALQEDQFQLVRSLLNQLLEGSATTTDTPKGGSEHQMH